MVLPDKRTRMTDYELAPNVILKPALPGLATAYKLPGTSFSPDGSTVFLNNLKSGLTFAITGPWKHLSKV
jgi:hypothetical protein